jgi:hypothetical protein
MKVKLIIAALLITASVNAQSFFGPLPKANVYSDKLGITVVDSSKLSMNAFKPVVAVSALVSDGTELSGGAGVAYSHYVWDQASQSWVTIWYVGAVGFLGTTGSTITGSAGIIGGIPGTNGIIGIGPLYNLTTKKFGLATGVTLQFK